MAASLCHPCLPRASLCVKSQPLSRSTAEASSAAPAPQTSDAKLAMTKFPAGVANEVIGMGMWRLKGSVDPLIELLTARIEGLFREMLEYDLSLYPTDKWKVGRCCGLCEERRGCDVCLRCSGHAFYQAWCSTAL